MAEEETKKISAMIILEVLGKPPEHLKETLENFIEQIGSEKGVNVKDKKIKEAKELEKKKGFYTSFAEIDVEVEEMRTLMMLVFKYMPAHVEIIEPEKIYLNNNTWGEMLSEMTRRFHAYDEVARVLQAEKSVLEKKIKGLLPKEDNKKEENKNE